MADLVTMHGGATNLTHIGITGYWGHVSFIDDDVQQSATNLACILGIRGTRELAF